MDSTAAPHMAASVRLTLRFFWGKGWTCSTAGSQWAPACHPIQAATLRPPPQRPQQTPMQWHVCSQSCPCRPALWGQEGHTRRKRLPGAREEREATACRQMLARAPQGMLSDHGVVAWAAQKGPGGKAGQHSPWPLWRWWPLGLFAEVPPSEQPSPSRGRSGQHHPKQAEAMRIQNTR